jgi:[FeFe] hydrogenase H-cluster maturation GTPase HydF
VLIIDTPGIDDAGSLGEQRVRQTRKVLNKADIAVLVVDATEGMTPVEEELVALFKAKQTPYLIAWNKSDLASESVKGMPPHLVIASGAKQSTNTPDDGLLRSARNDDGLECQVIRSSDTFEISISATRGDGIFELKELIARTARARIGDAQRPLVGDLVSSGDFVVLVVPIDSAAPKGRLILPQQQVIRDVLESDATAIVVKEHELKATLESLGKKPRLVITDSQAFAKVSADTPQDIPLTSFSILFARYKGDLEQAVQGVRALDSVKDGDRILICEGCTHHRQCDDIGTVKLPRWIREHTGAQPEFEFTSGGDFPDDIAGYKLIVHCGACMLNEREMKYRLAQASDASVPMTNYGILIAQTTGILQRAIADFALPPAG